MDRREFSIAMHLIKKTLLGFEIPPVLPSSLLVDQVAGPAMGAFCTGVAVPPYVSANPAPLSSRGGQLELLENKEFFACLHRFDILNEGIALSSFCFEVPH